MRTTSRLAVSAALLGGSLLLAAPVNAQEATSTPCPYPYDNCPTASPSVTASPTASPTVSPTTSPTASPSTTTAPPLGGGSENPAAGGGGGPAVVDNSPVRGSAGAAAQLPFTGGEVTLLALTGTAAVAGGLVLVAAGRRRATS